MTQKQIFLKDYQPPAFEIDTAELWFQLNEEKTFIEARLQLRRVLGIANSPSGLELDGGPDVELLEIELNGTKLNSTQYQRESSKLLIYKVPDQFELKTRVQICPQNNTHLSGLYRSQGLFVTQCEAQGFRNMTFFLDRPDVMTLFTVHIEADEHRYPLLLSNGDRIRVEKRPNGRHCISWRDPHKKACYLFALVAGDMGAIKDSFISQSGKKIALEIYAPKGHEHLCHHAMASLKKAMVWDEKRFGREYDLSTYMIVGIHDFNAGAMENKGLNIFNAKYIFADEKTATDFDYFHIESVVAHEYFHNWTGNRVTLRDWFHLSLKEGLTVFRDQEFSMDMSSRSLVRIDSVSELRDRQFSEDAGPTAHPIRPDSCYAVDNFYTSTIYEKGAEVIRMMQTMVGRPGFRKGMDLYFERHDGKAVIIEDFARCIAEANQKNWEQFQRWYFQAGTPEVKVSQIYDFKSLRCTIELEQSCPATPGQSEKLPFHIPLIFGLVSEDGTDMEIGKMSPRDTVETNSEGQTLIHLKKQKEKVVFENISSRPVLSINRQFSAPIRVHQELSVKEMSFLISKDSDEFNRWEIAQKLLTRAFFEVETMEAPLWAEPLRDTFLNSNLSPGFRAKILSLPTDSALLQAVQEFSSHVFLSNRNRMENHLALAMEEDFYKFYQNHHGKNIHSKDPLIFDERRLKNCCLYYLATNPKYFDLAWKQFHNAQIMTDKSYALMVISDNTNHPHREEALSHFYDEWKQNTLVLNRWFSIQAMSRAPDTFKRVKRLWDHPDFDMKNPNRVYSLLGSFGKNLVRFHDEAHDTYRFYADCVLQVDALNPQVAARSASAFTTLSKVSSALKQKAHRELSRIITQKLSPNTFEIVQKCLNLLEKQP